MKGKVISCIFSNLSNDDLVSKNALSFRALSRTLWSDESNNLFHPFITKIKKIRENIEGDFPSIKHEIVYKVSPLFWSILFSTVLGNPHAKRLYDDLLNNYNLLIRPVSNNTEKLTVRLGLKLSQLIDVVRLNERMIVI